MELILTKANHSIFINNICALKTEFIEEALDTLNAKPGRLNKFEWLAWQALADELKNRAQGKTT